MGRQGGQPGALVVLFTCVKVVAAGSGEVQTGGMLLGSGQVM